MKVSELIKRLSKLDPSLEIVGWSEDKDLQAPKHMIRLLDIVDVGVVEGERKRGDDQVPTIKIGQSSISGKLAVIEVTSDF